MVPQITSSTTVTAGVSFPVSFLVETAQGTLDPDDSGAVMLSVFTGPAGYLPISGVVPENPSNGTVSFPAVILDTVGSYVLQATGSNVTPGQTGTINVVLPTLVPQSTSSTTVTAGVSFPVTFLVETAQGTLDPDYSGEVMLSVFTGPAGYLPISGAGPEILFRTAW